MIVKFCKMQSLGNDFIMINMEQFARFNEVSIANVLNAKFFRKISSRHFGVGCDQVVLYRFNPKNKAAQIKFFNPDGTEAEVCGNATRCMGFLVFREAGEEKSVMFAGERRFEVSVEVGGNQTQAGVSAAVSNNENNQKNSNKREASVLWDSNTKIENLSEETLRDLIKICRDHKVEIDKAFSVNVGNPHLVLFLKNMPSKNCVRKLGEKLESHSAFMPARTNVGFCVKSEDKKSHAKTLVLNLNVFERGAGSTLGCGSGAMAAAIAARKSGIVPKNFEEILVHQRGGDLLVTFDKNGRVMQSGDVEYLFRGEVDVESEEKLVGEDVELERGKVEGIVEKENMDAKKDSGSSEDCKPLENRGVSAINSAINDEDAITKNGLDSMRDSCCANGFHKSEQKQRKITIYTDGACSGNPGPGGWGVLIIEDGKEDVEMFGGEPATTNNRMELMAVIKALESVSKNSEIELYTDSQYVKNGITQWIKTWVRNNWKNSDRKPVKNQDLWRKLLGQTLVLQANDAEKGREGRLGAGSGGGVRKENGVACVDDAGENLGGRSLSPSFFSSAYLPRAISWNWVRGHNGDVNNERVDALARRGCKEVES